jgi:hypothetical protein
VRLARLAGNRMIGDSGVAALAAALPQMASLTTLNLSGTATAAALGLRLWGWGMARSRRQCAQFASACGRTVGLWAAGGRVGGAVRLVRLAGNQIGDSGAVALAAALPQMASLTTLNLGGTSTAAALGLRVWGLGHGLLTAVVGAVCPGVRAFGRVVGCGR